MKKVVCLLLAMILVMATLTLAFAEEKKVLGFSSAALEEVYHLNIYNAFCLTAEELGYDVKMVDNKLSETEQVSGCISLINQGVDVLCINPCKPDALGPILEAAEEKGIPVIIIDIGTGGNTNYDLFIISNNYEGGLMAAEYCMGVLNEKFAGKEDENSKEVAILTSRPTNPTGQSRATAFDNYFTENGYTVVSHVTGQDDEAIAYSTAMDTIVAHPDIVCYFASGAAMSTNAAMAMVDAGKDVVVCGFDGTTQEIEAIKEGYEVAAVQQFPYYMGYLAAVNADRLIKGEEIPYDNAEEKTIYCPVQMLDASNVNDLHNAPAGYETIVDLDSLD